MQLVCLFPLEYLVCQEEQTKVLLSLGKIIVALRKGSCMRYFEFLAAQPIFSHIVFINWLEPPHFHLPAPHLFCTDWHRCRRFDKLLVLVTFNSLSENGRISSIVYSPKLSMSREINPYNFFSKLIRYK